MIERITDLYGTFINLSQLIFILVADMLPRHGVPEDIVTQRLILNQSVAMDSISIEPPLSWGTPILRILYTILSA